jgi:tyrosinase
MKDTAMLSRRDFVAATTSSLATSFVISAPSRAQTPRVRRDVMDFADNDPFFQKYADAVRAMHQLPETDGRNWRRQAKIHADFCKHRQLEFLHWHRHYINFFEAICGQLIGDPNFTLPYWNWSKKSGVIPAPFFDIDALNVESWNDPGVYSPPNWPNINTVGKRGLQKGQGLLSDPIRGGSFTSATIDEIKTMPTADLFFRRLEGSPHNDGHIVAGATASGRRGHIGSGLSPLDPIFWLHHCMVDRVWAEWQHPGNDTPDPGTTYSNNFFNKDGSAVVSATSGAVLNISSLGYTYDVLQGAVTGAPAGAGPVGGGPAAPGGLQLDAIIPDLNKALQESSQTRRLGEAQSGAVAPPLVETAVSLKVPGLLNALGSERVYRQFSARNARPVAVEGRRILANILGVKPSDEANQLVVNVFVNCDYLSPTTPFVDPHYAGTFSFFGPAHADHSDDGFLVDITAPVRSLDKEGKLKGEELTVQFMPLPAHAQGEAKATFQVGRVEILTV